MYYHSKFRLYPINSFKVIVWKRVANQIATADCREKQSQLGFYGIKSAVLISIWSDECFRLWPRINWLRRCQQQIRPSKNLELDIMTISPTILRSSDGRFQSYRPETVIQSGGCCLVRYARNDQENNLRRDLMTTSLGSQFAKIWWTVSNISPANQQPIIWLLPN